MDQAGRYTAEHNVMDANIKISSLEGRIKELLKENKQLIEETKYRCFGKRNKIKCRICF